MYGLFGMTISGNQLNNEYFQNIDAFEVSQLFGFPIVHEEEIHPAIKVVIELFNQFIRSI